METVGADDVVAERQLPLGLQLEDNFEEFITPSMQQLRQTEDRQGYPPFVMRATGYWTRSFSARRLQYSVGGLIPDKKVLRAY